MDDLKGSVHLAGYEGLHHLPCVISLWPRLRNPLVLATFEQLVLDIAAGISIGLRESRLYRWKNIVVEGTLHYQEWHLCDRLVPVEDLLRIAFVDRVPGDEECRVVPDHRAALPVFRILVAGERVADGRAHRDVCDRGVGLRRFPQRDCVVPGIPWPHGEQLRNMASARTAV